MRRRLGLVLALGLLAGLGAVATAASPVPPTGDPRYTAAAVADRAAAEKRGLDQDANPVYTQLMAPLLAEYAADQVSGAADSAILIDPFLPGWSGTIRPAAFVNRYGATLRGHFYVPKLPWRDPVTGRSRSHGLPGLLFMPGLGSDDSSYRGMLEQLADAGYVVLAIAPQGQGQSDVDPNPKSVYCDPNGAWRQPQEDGLRETGSCAGYDGHEDTRGATEALLDDTLVATPAGGDNAAAQLVDTAGFEVDVQKAKLTGDWSDVFAALAAGYRNFRTRYVFGAYDAAAWLRSGANPLAHVMNADSLGIVGHSAGSDAALVAGNGDPRHRFSAAVAWDDYGTPPASVHPTVPTLMFQTEQQQLVGPWLPKPADHLWPAYAVAAHFAVKEVPVGVLALRGSTHQEWSYIPYAANDPKALLINSNGLAGEVALHETVAWLDRFLKTGPDAKVADARLWQRTLDGSTDASSRGQGSYDALTQGNQPYTAGGTSLDTDLSRIFASELLLDHRTCRRWQFGC